MAAKGGGGGAGGGGGGANKNGILDKVAVLDREAPSASGVVAGREEAPRGTRPG